MHNEPLHPLVVFTYVGSSYFDDAFGRRLFTIDKRKSHFAKSSEFFNPRTDDGTLRAMRVSWKKKNKNAYMAYDYGKFALAKQSK